MRTKNIFSNILTIKLSTFTEENNNKNSVQVAFLGDSLIDGYDLPFYFSQYTTTNRGIGGDTTFKLEKRLKLSAFDINSNIVIMLIGANNINTMFDNFILLIFILKTISIILYTVYKKSFFSLHSILNKVTGILLFLFPITLNLINVNITAIILCTIATIASIEEFLVVIKNRPTKKR